MVLCDNKSTIYTLRYAERIATGNMRRTTAMILGAWCMALVISLPMHINSPGFSNFSNVTDESLKEGGCLPPVGVDSKESYFSKLIM